MQRDRLPCVRRLVRTLALSIALTFSAFPSVARAQEPAMPAVKSIALPDAPPDGVNMDYLAYDHVHHRVWVPAGNTGNVDVVDVRNGRIAKIDGFVTSEVERQGRKRAVGPSSAAVGVGVVYIGNRGDSSICVIEADSLRKGACVKLGAMPDALVYVRSTKEIWATTPRDKSITIVAASAPGSLSAKA